MFCIHPFNNKGQVVHQCTDCEYISTRRTSVNRHMESKHVGLFVYGCDICLHGVPAKNALSVHKIRNHMSPATAQLQDAHAGLCRTLFNKFKILLWWSYFFLWVYEGPFLILKCGLKEKCSCLFKHMESSRRKHWNVSCTVTASRVFKQDLTNVTDLVTLGSKTLHFDFGWTQAIYWSDFHDICANYFPY